MVNRFKSAWKHTDNFRQNSLLWFWGVEVVGGGVFGVIGGLLGADWTPPDVNNFWQNAYPTIGGGIGVIAGFIIIFGFILAWNFIRAPYNEKIDNQKVMASSTGIPDAYIKLFDINPILTKMNDYLVKTADKQEIKGVDINKFNLLSAKINEILNVKTRKVINPNQTIKEMTEKVKLYFRQSEKKMGQKFKDSYTDEDKIKKITNLIDSDGCGLKKEKTKGRKYLKYKKQISRYYNDNKELMDLDLKYLITFHISLSEFLANGLLIIKETDWISKIYHVDKIKQLAPPTTQANIEGLENKSNDPLSQVRTVISEYIREKYKDEIVTKKVGSQNELYKSKTNTA